MEKLKVLELFGGIGACTSALKRLNIPFEIVDYVEIDKYAVSSFNAINNTNFEPQDVMTWDKDINVDLIMHGSPCQDFSLAGKQAGGDKNSGTRSSLMYETIRIVEKLKPTYVIWENVKNILCHKHRHNFDNYLASLEKLGYKNYYQVLNAKDFGIPQNRERVFTISILKGTFEFPKKEPLKIRLKDLLEDDVDEKYFLTDKQIESIKNSDFVVNSRRIQQKDYCDTICARDWKDPKCIQVGNADIKGYDLIKRVYSKEGISPALSAMQGGNLQPKILIKNATKKGYLEANAGDGCYISNMNTKRGTVQKGMTPTIKTKLDVGVVVDTNSDLRVRKLTPKECWRLMGFTDEEYNMAAEINSNTQLYKQAGNSIVVNVLVEIFKNLLLH